MNIVIVIGILAALGILELINILVMILESIGRYRKKIRAIDSNIRELVDSFNSIPGVETLYSCEGHQATSQSYVTFIAPNEFTYQLHQWLGQKLLHGEGSLRYCWSLTARWHDKDEGTKLGWTLRPVDSRLDDELALCRRGRLDHDFCAIVDFLRAYRERLQRPGANARICGSLLYIHRYPSSIPNIFLPP